MIKLIFMHGWGFDSSFWDAIKAFLPEYESLALDAGYYGDPFSFPVEDDDAPPFIAIGHSFGVMRLLSSPLERCVGLVSINGFDHFTKFDGVEGGIAPRVIGRMIERFQSDAGQVLKDFQKRCGVTEPQIKRHLNEETLLADLISLRDDNVCQAIEKCDFPVLSLTGAKDPLVDHMLRQNSFAAARQINHYEHEEGGHLLPLTAAAWCAGHIRSFAIRHFADEIKNEI